MTHNPNGRILYHGPSMLDGAPIVMIATGFAEASGNDKTGSMIQTWIMRADLPPHHAFKGPEGASVCGDCMHSGTNLATCYVKWFQAPLAVWNCWHRGAGYAPAAPSDWRPDMQLRLGSAGDPAAVPEAVWRSILPLVSSDHTGYTHQWARPVGSWLRGIVQASCDSEPELLAARAAGWRAFTVLPIGSPDPAGTVHCPASKERGMRTNCASCSMCDGSTADVIIWAHGNAAGRIQSPGACGAAALP